MKYLATALIFSLTSLSLSAQLPSFGELSKNTIQFGYTCGFTGMPPEYRVTLNNLVEAKDSATIEGWLTSMVPEIQVYGVEGIYQLMEKGVAFDASVFERIDELSQYNTKIKTCAGCILRDETMAILIASLQKRYKQV